MNTFSTSSKHTKLCQNETAGLQDFNRCYKIPTSERMAPYLDYLGSKPFFMSQENDNKKKNAEEEKSAIQPDPETLNTTDPQEEMEGPISSLVNGVKKEVEKNDEESAAEATKKRDEHM
jgi:hypothetical protein